MSLRSVAEGVWCHEGTHSMMLMELPVRSTILTLSGGVIIHAPIPFDEATAAEVDALGEVTHLVAPNLHHSSYLAAAKARWPEALVCMPPGLAKKRKDVARDVRLDGEPVEAWGDELEYIGFAGTPMLGEVVFFHRPSGTLIACDLAFNVCSADSALFRGYLKINGAYGHLAQTKLVRAIVRDKPAARASLEQMFDWPWDRLIVSHGDVVESDAKAQLRDAAAWLLNA